MTPRPPPPPPTNLDAPDLMRMMESVLIAMQNQNVALVKQNTVALQQLDAARMSNEVSQRRYVELMSSGRVLARPSSSSPTVSQD